MHCGMLQGRWRPPACALNCQPQKSIFQPMKPPQKCRKLVLPILEKHCSSCRNEVPKLRRHPRAACSMV